ncbi:hypothetical protein HDU91_006448 [Kappamyces sp. JEL0680]|nr:hypothetical protein HDU91_006448 [Kappamyces sp. JEL0680]
MPFDLEGFPPGETIKLLSNYITFVISSNDKKSEWDGRKPTRFHAKTLPSIDILGYLTRILKYAPCGTECFLAMVIYLQRVSVRGRLIYRSEAVDGLEEKLQSTHIGPGGAAPKKDIVVDSYNIHRLLITASLVSIKFLSDTLIVAGVGGVPVNELNQMELEFLKMADFALMVTPDELVQAGDSLVHFSIHYRPGQDYVLPPLLPNPSSHNASSTVPTLSSADSGPVLSGTSSTDFIDESSASVVSSSDSPRKEVLVQHNLASHHSLVAEKVRSHGQLFSSFSGRGSVLAQRRRIRRPSLQTAPLIHRHVPGMVAVLQTVSVHSMQSRSQPAKKTRGHRRASQFIPKSNCCSHLRKIPCSKCKKAKRK